MKTLHGCYTFFTYLFRYLFSKLKLVSPPLVDENREGLLHVLGHFTKWNRYIRIRGAENVPLNHPAVFCANHVMLGDPLYVYKGIYDASNTQIKCRAMTRDDFFKGSKLGSLLKTRLFDADDFMLTLGIHGISRGNVTMPQMKAFVEILVKGDSFLMFPGRTRSRSGMFFEYRGDVTEPGGAAFFLGMAQRKKKDIIVSVVPVSRNYNPVRDHTCMIHGEEVFLPPKAGKEEQRAFDFSVVEKIAELAEICVPQVVAAFIYTVCVHHLSDSISDSLIKEWVKKVRADSTHPYWDEEDDVDLNAAVEMSLIFLHECRMLDYKNGIVSLFTDKILTVPEPEVRLMKINPIQFLTNQLLHLAEVTNDIQDVVLSSELNK